MRGRPAARPQGLPRQFGTGQGGPSLQNAGYLSLASAQFPPLEEKNLAAFREGVDPLLLFVDLVPYQTPAADGGVLGLFGDEDVSVANPTLEQANALRLLKVSRERLRPVLQSFDSAKTRDANKRFAIYLEQKSGKPPASSPPDTSLLDASLKLLSDLKAVVEAAAKDSVDLCIRYLTEAEAASETAVDAVRRALQGPRIILLS